MKSLRFAEAFAFLRNNVLFAFFPFFLLIRIWFTSKLLLCNICLLFTRRKFEAGSIGTALKIRGFLSTYYNLKYNLSDFIYHFYKTRLLNLDGFLYRLYWHFSVSYLYICQMYIILYIIFISNRTQLYLNFIILL